MSSRALAFALATLAALLLAATPAAAKELHAFTASFGAAASTPANPYPLISPTGLAVDTSGDASNGDVYVTDPANHWVEKFDSAGNLVWIAGKAVDKSTGANLCTVASHDECQPGEEGSSPGAFQAPTFVAVDNSAGPSQGDVYVADTEDNMVTKFTPEGALVSAWGSSGQLNGSAAEEGPFSTIAGIATDASGNLFVYDSNRHWFEFAQDGTPDPTVYIGRGTSPVGIGVDSAGDYYKVLGYGVLDKFESSGSEIGEVDTAGNDTAFAIAPLTNDIYVDSGGSAVSHYPPSCEPASGACVPADVFGSAERGGGELEGATGLAVGPAQSLYVADTSKQRIDVFTEAPALPVTASVKGTGVGTVTSPPTGLDCGNGADACEAEFAEGSTATVTATPNERSTFSGWTGCTTVNGDKCEIEMTEAKTVEAEFTAKAQETLTVIEPGAGLGGGTVTAPPPGPEFTAIECGNAATACSEHYNQGEMVTLTAAPTERSTFTGWTGCTTVNGDECEVEMTEAKTVEAKFTAKPQEMLTVAVEGSGSVTTASPGPEFPAIECGNGATTCEGQYNKDTTLVLIATPSSYNHFASWGAGECEVANANECTITMNAAKSVRADFLPTMHKLTVIRSGPGSITSLPSGISCGEDQCQAEFQEGSTVTLIAHPDTHNRLAGWTGGVCAGEPSPSECEVEIGASNVHVKGEFAPIQHTLRVVSDGGGSVTASSGGISGCAPGGGVCAAQYVEASTVALTASPFSHSTFHAWTGCTHSSGNTCEVEIGLGTTEVKAEFAPNEHTLTVSPTGLGSVTASSGSIRGCESAGGNCAGEYIEAFALTLTATPAPHQAVAWSGCTHSSEDTCEVEIGSSDQGVEANFSEITYTLGLTQAGTGKGTIACNGSPCASSYPEGTRLTLNASPAAGSTFVGWSGGGCSGIGPCELNLNADTTLSATFIAKAPPPTEEHCVVPSLAGKTLTQARSALTAANCTLGKVVKPKKKGRLVVKSSSPGAGATLPAANKVNLRLGSKSKKRKRRNRS